MQDRVLQCYEDGVAAITQIGSGLSEDAAPTPCAEWSTSDLMGHLLAIARYYHRLLDKAEAGAPLSGLPRGENLRAMNARDLMALPEQGLSARQTSLAPELSRLIERLRATSWSQLLGSWEGLGPLTVAEHTGVAIGEWHVHAWDLARASGSDHQPADPEIVAIGQSAVGRVCGGADPWGSVLAAYGRNPAWAPNG